MQKNREYDTVAHQHNRQVCLHAHSTHRHIQSCAHTHRCVGMSSTNVSALPIVRWRTMGGSDGCRTRVLELQGSRSKRRARQKVEPLRILLPVTTGNGERVTVEWPSVGAEWLPLDKKHRGAWCCGKFWHQVVAQGGAGGGSSKWVVNSGVLARCTDAWIPSLRPPLHARIGHPTPPPSPPS